MKRLEPPTQQRPHDLVPSWSGCFQMEQENAGASLQDFRLCLRQFPLLAATPRGKEP